MTPEEEAKLEEGMAQSKREIEELAVRMESEIGWLHQEQDKWEKRATEAMRKKKGDRVILYTLAAMDASSDIYKIQTDITFMSELNRLGIESVRNHIGLVKLLEKFPDVEKTKAEFDRILQDEVSQLREIAKKLEQKEEERKKEQASRPAPKGMYGD